MSTCEHAGLLIFHHDCLQEQEHVDGLTQGGVLVSTTNPLQLPDINFEPEGPTGASPGPDMSAGGPEPAAGTGGLARQHGTAASTLVMASAPYSALQPARMQELALFVEAAAGRALMHRTRAVLELAGWQRCLAAAPSAEDQCCLALAEQYVRLLQGHVWASLERGYTQQGIRPTTPDRWVQRLACCCSACIARHAKHLRPCDDCPDNSMRR